jgi:hypothetical protein
MFLIAEVIGSAIAPISHSLRLSVHVKEADGAAIAAADTAKSDGRGNAGPRRRLKATPTLQACTAGPAFGPALGPARCAGPEGPNRPAAIEVSPRARGRLPALHVGRSGSRPRTDVSARAAGDGRGSDLGPDPVSLMGEGGEGGQWRDVTGWTVPGEKRVDYGWDALLVGVAGQT